jgi:hypothetical protein
VWNLGLFYQRAGRPAEAIPLLEEAFQWERSASQPRAEVGRILIEAYVAVGKAAEAVKLSHECLSDTRKHLKPDSPQLADQLAVAGSQLLGLKEFASAEPILRECLVLREKLVTTNQVLPWRVASAKSMLGGALLGQKKYADVEPLLLAGYDGLQKDEKLIPRDLTSIPDVLQRLVDLY